jgi:hypothetical protein
MMAINGLYSLWFDAATPHKEATWNVFGEGFGLRCFYTRSEAIKAAEAHFGTAKFTLRTWPDRTELHVAAAPDADPATVLKQAISALEAELAELSKCPAHSRQPTNRTQQ